MPSSHPPSKNQLVLISGINGYIASRIGYDLLQQGYTVRGTTRSKQSADALLDGAYAPFAERVEMVEIEDMTFEGAFDTAVKGAHYILHTASPLSYADATWSNTVDTAVSSALGILHSAYTHAGPQLCTFVLTSSFASAFNPSTPAPKTFTENDWNTHAETKARELEAQGVQGEEIGRVLYPTSKLLAERAVWAWKTKNNPQFAIATINPTITIGPPVQPPMDPTSLNETLKPMWHMLSGALSALPPAKPLSAYVDVRDVSRLHISAALNPSRSDGHRYLVATGRAPPQAMADVIRRFFPRYRDRVPLGRPGEGYRSDYAFPIEEGGMAIDCQRAKEELALAGGGEWTGFEQSVRDTVGVFEKVYARWLD